MGNYIEYINWYRKTHLNCGQTIPWAGCPRLDKVGESMLNKCAMCQLLQLPDALASLV